MPQSAFSLCTVLFYPFLSHATLPRHSSSVLSLKGPWDVVPGIVRMKSLQTSTHYHEFTFFHFIDEENEKRRLNIVPTLLQ